MKHPNLLTKKKAEQFLNNSDSLVLSGFTQIEKSAAQALAIYDGPINLSGLANLSKACAKALALHKGDLDLSGLMRLTTSVAQELGQHKGPLRLSGIKRLTNSAAHFLAEHKPRSIVPRPKYVLTSTLEQILYTESLLDLSGLTSLSDKAAQKLARHQGGLKLSGLTKFPNSKGHLALATKLSQDNSELDLSNLKNLNKGIARILAAHKQNLLLSKLKTLNVQTANALAFHKGYICLSSIARLSSATALALSKHNGHLNLSGLSKLGNLSGHVALAETLSAWHNDPRDMKCIDLPSLTSLGYRSALALSKCKGFIDLSAIRKLSPKTASALLEHNGQIPSSIEDRWFWLQKAREEGFIKLLNLQISTSSKPHIALQKKLAHPEQWLTEIEEKSD